MNPAAHARVTLAFKLAQPVAPLKSALHLVLVALLVPSAAAQAPPTVPTTLRSDSSEVLVDVVIRNKHGRLVRGVRPDEVKVLEDGVPQRVTSFREVRRQSADEPAGPRMARGSVQMSRQIRLVSLVYDHLGPDGRRLSRQASLDFLKHDLGPNVYYGVFAIDRGFRALQPYTDDASRLRAAIREATSGERSNFAANTQGLDEIVATGANPDGSAIATPAPAPNGQSPSTMDGASFSAVEAARMAREMEDMADEISREDLGRMSVFSLWAIVKELEKLPGRKTVLYFAEGLQMPNGLVEQFKSMISAANVANISVYAIDARGLTTASDQGDANRRLATAAAWSRYARSTQTESAAANKQEFRTFDRMLDSLRANQQNVMMELAESTGGFLIANTNDLRPKLTRLSEDFKTYYEITYRPEHQLTDGRFRAIAVEVNRPDAVVQARSGYFALPRAEGLPVLAYEVPLLKALGQTPMPKNVVFRSRVLQFRWAGSAQDGVLVFDMPLAQVTFSKDEAAGKYRTHLSVLALLKDDQGRVVAKLSRDVPLNEPLDRLEGFRLGHFIVTRTVTLPPGRYTLESAAADQEGRRVGAARSVLVIGGAGAGPRLSELVLVRRVEPPAETPDRLDPFQLVSGRVVPTLADSIPGGAGKLVSLFLTMYPDSALSGRPQAVLDVLKDGKLLSRLRPELPAADNSGAIPYVANVPLDRVVPGQYQFRATLIQGRSAAQRSIYVTIE